MIKNILSVVRFFFFFDPKLHGNHHQAVPQRESELSADGVGYVLLAE
jgi:hypothetical protein